MYSNDVRRKLNTKWYNIYDNVLMKAFNPILDQVRKAYELGFFCATEEETTGAYDNDYLNLQMNAFIKEAEQKIGTSPYIDFILTNTLNDGFKARREQMKWLKELNITKDNVNYLGTELTFIRDVGSFHCLCLSNTKEWIILHFFDNSVIKKMPEDAIKKLLEGTELYGKYF